MSTNPKASAMAKRPGAPRSLRNLINCLLKNNVSLWKLTCLASRADRVGPACRARYYPIRGRLGKYQTELLMTVLTTLSERRLCCLIRLHHAGRRPPGTSPDIKGFDGKRCAKLRLNRMKYFC